MNALKAIQTCFPHKSSSLFRGDKSNSLRRSTVCFSNSEPQDGDKRKQELLAEMAMLQTQKVRLTDFLDDRSAHLSQIAEEANAEFDAIGENALKELDDAQSRILEKLESRMQAFEESAEMSGQENDRDERALEEVEEEIARGRNEGLFFKNLREATPKKKAGDKEEVATVKKSIWSRGRQRLYLGLISLMVLAIGNALLGSPEIEWKKVGAMALILAGLLAQSFYEQSLSSAADDSKKEK